tara:strand:+ start:2170 stop:2661 length:492 start_codon:yes stop_codon:yes gene_type:complete
MSTRSTLTVRTDNSTIHFYRHWDGYIAEAGQTIQLALAEAYNYANANASRSLGGSIEHPHFKKFVNIIMNYKYAASKYRSEPVYELIEDPVAHADREYHYEVTFNDAGYVNIEVEAWLLNLDEKTQRHEVIFDGGFDAYKELVTKEMAIIAERIAELEKKRGA